MCVSMRTELHLTCVVEPLLQQRFEFAHVLEAQVQGLESGDGGLAEVVAVEFPHR